MPQRTSPHARRSRLLSAHAAIGLGVALLVLGVYILTLAPSIVIGDSGELVTAASTLGIPHPPGYPLWCLVMRLFTLIPFESPAVCVNLGSAFFGAVAAGLFFRIATNMGRIPARIAAPLTLAHALTPALWGQATIAEVYTFNLAVVLTLCLVYASRGRIGRLLPFAGGVALVAHGTNALLVVPFALARLRALWSKRSIRQMSGFAGLFVLGLSPLLYLPLRSQAGPLLDWGHPADFDGFLAHVSRRAYGGFVWPGFEDWATFQVNWLSIGSTLSSVLVWILAAFTVLHHRSPVTRRWWAWLLLAGPITATVLVGLLRGEQLVECEVFFLPAHALLLLIAGRGIATARPRFHTVAGVLLMIGSGWLFITGRSAADKSDNWIALDFGRALLEAVPDDAVLFVVGDHEAFPIIYLQTVRGFRPGVSIRALRSSADRDAYGQAAPSLRSVLQNRSRPIYVTLAAPPFPPESCVPQGPVLRVGSGTPRWRPIRVRYRHDAALTYFERATLAMIRYHEAGYLFATGRSDAAVTQASRAAAIAPENSRVLNNVASLLARYDRGDLAGSMWTQAIQADPRILLVWENLIRLELNRGRIDEARSLIERAREVHPNAPELTALGRIADRESEVPGH